MSGGNKKSEGFGLDSSGSDDFMVVDSTTNEPAENGKSSVATESVDEVKDDASRLKDSLGDDSSMPDSSTDTVSCHKVAEESDRGSNEDMSQDSLLDPPATKKFGKFRFLAELNDSNTEVVSATGAAAQTDVLEQPSGHNSEDSDNEPLIKIRRSSRLRAITSQKKTDSQPAGRKGAKKKNASPVIIKEPTVDTECIPNSSIEEDSKLSSSKINLEASLSPAIAETPKPAAPTVNVTSPKIEPQLEPSKSHTVALPREPKPLQKTVKMPLKKEILSALAEQAPQRVLSDLNVAPVVLCESPVTPVPTLVDSAGTPGSADSGFKLKSRWLNRTEQEQKEDDYVENLPIMPAFEEILENSFLTERKRSKSCKDAKRMVCECNTSAEDREAGKIPCGDNCLNRLLYMECGPRCPCGPYCTNRRFQKRQWAQVEAFYAGSKKGWGLRACELIPRHNFIIEFVGEVLSGSQFTRRLKEYEKEGREKFHYFMALSADEVVDATRKGTVTRFVNHSCDPNAETQKWTVNGYLRVGFFAKRDIYPGEEICFDYQYQRFGESEECYCGSSSCRGYIGGGGEFKCVLSEETEEEDTASGDEAVIQPAKDPSPVAVQRRKPKKKRKSKGFGDQLLDEEISRLGSVGRLRNQDHVWDLCRLMVRAESASQKLDLLRLLKASDGVCWRLFLESCGLQMLWMWMKTSTPSVLRCSLAEVLELNLMICDVLSKLPIPHKNMIEDSKIPLILEDWTEAGHSSDFKALISATSQDESSSRSSPTSTPEHPPVSTWPFGDPAGSDEEVVRSCVIHLINLVSQSLDGICASPRVVSASLEEDENSELSDLLLEKRKELAAFSTKLISQWKKLKEKFKIPKKTPAEVLRSERLSNAAKESSQARENISKASESVQSPLEWKKAHHRDDYGGRGDRRDRERDRISGGRSRRSRSPRNGRRRTPSPPRPTYRDRGYRRSPSPRRRNYDRRYSPSRSRRSPSPQRGQSSSYRSRSPYGNRKRKQDDKIRDTSEHSTCKLSKEERRKEFEEEMARREVMEQRQRQEMEIDEVMDEFNQQYSQLSSQQSSLFPDMSQSQSRTTPGGPGEVAPPSSAVIRSPPLSSIVAAPLPPPIPVPPVPFMGGLPRVPSAPMFPPGPPCMPPGPSFAQPFTTQTRTPVPLSATSGFVGTAPVTQPASTQPMAFPAILVHDPNTLKYWWQDQSTMVLIYPADDHQVAAVMKNDFSVVPHFYHDLETGLIHEVRLEVGPDIPQATEARAESSNSKGPVAAACGSEITQESPLDTPSECSSSVRSQSGSAVRRPRDAKQTTLLADYDDETATKAQISALQKQLESLQQKLEQKDKLNSQVVNTTAPVLPQPSGLPPNWRQAVDKEGDTYYYYAGTKQTQWEKPVWSEKEIGQWRKKQGIVPSKPIIAAPSSVPPAKTETTVLSEPKRVGPTTTTAAADTSSENARKIKEHFKTQLSHSVVKFLSLYRKTKIANNEDFKHLARKLTHAIMEKELKSKRFEELKCNEHVLNKAKDYVKRYMGKVNGVYKRTD